MVGDRNSKAKSREFEPPRLHQNPIAKDLRTPKYRLRVVSDKTKYNKKEKYDLDTE